MASVLLLQRVLTCHSLFFEPALLRHSSSDALRVVQAAAGAQVQVLYDWQGSGQVQTRQEQPFERALDTLEIVCWRKQELDSGWR